MNAIFSTILFVLPGIIAMLVANQLGQGSSRKLSDYEMTLYGTALSVPVLLTVWGIYELTVPTDISLQQFFQLIKPEYHSILYLLVATCVACVYGFLLGKWLLRWSENFINKLRGMNVTFHSESVWETFAESRDEALVKVYKLGESDKAYIGILKRWSTAIENENGILMLSPEEYNSLSSYLHYPKRAYLNTSTNTIYEYFDLQQVKKALVEKKKAERVET